MTYRFFLAWILVIGLALPGSLLAEKPHEESQTQQRPIAEKPSPTNCEYSTRINIADGKVSAGAKIHDLKPGDVFISYDPNLEAGAWKIKRKNGPALLLFKGTVVPGSALTENGGDDLYELQEVGNVWNWVKVDKEKEQKLARLEWNYSRGQWKLGRTIYPNGRKRQQQAFASARSPSKEVCVT